MKRIFVNILLSVGTLIVTLGILEFVLGYFPVMQVTRTLPLTESGRPFDVSTVKNSLISGSQGFDFAHAQTRRTNNYGFFSDFDFEENTLVNLAIGDSFTQAMQVDFTDTFHQLTAAVMGEPFYPLAISGNPLSQYEAYTQQACDTFDINKAVYLIVRNDFDESLYEHRRRSGFFHYRTSDAGVELRPTPFRLDVVKRLITRSNLVRYLYFNLNAGSLLSSRKLATANPAEKQRARQEQLQANLEAIEIFLSRIDKYCLTQEDMIFVVVADRQKMHGGEPYPNFEESRAYFMDKARESGFQVIDLEPVFMAHFAEHGIRFDFEHDAHWNALGHRLAAEALSDHLSKL